MPILPWDMEVIIPVLGSPIPVLGMKVKHGKSII